MPDLGSFRDVSEFVTKSGYGSVGLGSTTVCEVCSGLFVATGRGVGWVGTHTLLPCVQKREQHFRARRHLRATFWYMQRRPASPWCTLMTHTVHQNGQYAHTYTRCSPVCPQESEGEDAEASRVTLAQDMGKGNSASRQSRVRLHEIGPRIDMELIKVRWGVSMCISLCVCISGCGCMNSGRVSAWSRWMQSSLCLRFADVHDVSLLLPCLPVSHFAAAWHPYPHAPPG